MVNLADFVISEMTKDYIKPFLKSNGVSNVTLNKDKLLEELYGLFNDGKITEEQFLDFIARAFQYGNNRIILTSLINIPSTSPILERDSLYDILEGAQLPRGNFNIIKELDSSDRSNSPKLVYQKITIDNNQVKKIEQCYFNTTIQTKIIDGEQVSSLLRVFNWITIDLVLKRVYIHTKNNGFNSLDEARSLRGINNSILNQLSQIFLFSVNQAIHEKKTLYNIYKEMTDTAEEIFRKKVAKESVKVTKFYQEMSESLEYDITNDTIMLKDRIIRLFERGLIVQNFDLYSDYFEGKLGIIQRIVFCDGTGANVSAKVLDNNENISNYEIYFDTRDTLDKKQSLDKLWAKWYIKLPNRTNKIDYDVKFVVYDNFYVTHFIGQYLLEEVADYVFSKFREFEF
ncbi:hypothetical protein [Enterococcus italicus]|uniref:hypothetical protein n=1 Tax=Enterococcus italicus TaxID=246144 RepID=UPI0028AD6A60|nr:hypothetical protein [Enterococcus italicus]